MSSVCSFPQELANSIFVYLRGDVLPRTKIYFSDNGGYSFQDLNRNSLVSETVSPETVWGKGVKSLRWRWLWGGPALHVQWVINAEGKEGHLLGYCGSCK